MPDLLDRLVARVEICDDGCWRWTGRLHNGYGQIQVGNRHPMVHRAAYELLVAPIPAGLELDHTCRVRCCINPDHLEPVTGRINKLRGRTVNAANATKTHCPRGHELAGDNLRIDARGRRRCRTCIRQQDREWKRAHYVPRGSA